MRTYNPRNIPLARHLRKNMTPWERKLWYNYLRNCPVRFQRQKAIGGYIGRFQALYAGTTAGRCPPHCVFYRQPSYRITLHQSGYR